MNSLEILSYLHPESGGVRSSKTLATATRPLGVMTDNITLKVFVTSSSI